MLTSIVKMWISAVAVITLLCGIIYVAVQQNYRSNANDPQIQMAEDMEYLLRQGGDPKTLMRNEKTEISLSLTPYLILYNEHGEAITSDGVLDGKIPSMPAGVLDFTRQNTEDRITWQPREGVRSALEVLHVPGYGFIVAGRSLREVEEREQMLTTDILIGWIVSCGLLLLLFSLIQFFLRERLKTA